MVGTSSLNNSLRDKKNIFYKNILSLKNYKRIDPVFDPPLIIEINEDFNNQNFQNKLKNI